MFKRVLAASALAVVALVLVMIVGCANAGPVVWSDTFDFEGGKSRTYTATSGGVYGFTVDLPINRICVYNAQDWASPPGLSLTYSMSYVTAVPSASSRYIDSDLYIDAVKVGSCRHGYSKPAAGGPNVLYYNVIFYDLDLSGYSGRQYVTIETPVSGLTFKLANTNENKWTGGELESGDAILGYFGDDHYRFCAYIDDGAVPVHSYYVNVDLDFCNEITITKETGYYLISIDKTTGCPHTASAWHVVDSEVQYINESTMTSVDIESYVTYSSFDSFCDGLMITADGQCGIDYSASPGALCDYVPAYYTLSGKTYSIYGNIVPVVNVTYQSDLVTTDELGYFSFSGCSEAGESEILAVKDGYHNTTLDFLGTSASDYWVPLYMIPLDALDEGEFGGVVYDYCSLEPILGAYVYLFNETADSGSYAYSNKYGFYRFAGMAENLSYKVSASKDGYDASIIHSFTFNESNVNETHRKTKDIWLLPEDGCPEDGGIPTPPPAPTPPPHEWTNEEIVSWLRVNLMGLFIIVLLFTFMWFLRKAGGSRR